MDEGWRGWRRGEKGAAWRSARSSLVLTGCIAETGGMRQTNPSPDREGTANALADAGLADGITALSPGPRRGSSKAASGHPASTQERR